MIVIQHKVCNNLSRDLHGCLAFVEFFLYKNRRRHALAQDYRKYMLHLRSTSQCLAYVYKLFHNIGYVNILEVYVYIFAAGAKKYNFKHSLYAYILEYISL